MHAGKRTHLRLPQDERIRDLGIGRVSRNRLVEPCVNFVMLARKRRLDLGYRLQIDQGDPLNNEGYTTRVHMLKRQMGSALKLEHDVTRPSSMLADLFGGTVAALAMAVAVIAGWFGQVMLGLSTYDFSFVLLVVGAYIMKDRIKVWGGRYFSSIMKRFFGLEIPDHVIFLKDCAGHKIGEVREDCSTSKAHTLADDLLMLRHGSAGGPGKARVLAKLVPEHVVKYRKLLFINWTAPSSLKRVAKLSDRTRLDIGSLLHRMEDPMENHFMLVDCSREMPRSLSMLGPEGSSPRGAGSQGTGGSPPAGPSPKGAAGSSPSGRVLHPFLDMPSDRLEAIKVPCARVYEAHIVVRVQRHTALLQRVEQSLERSTAKLGAVKRAAMHRVPSMVLPGASDAGAGTEVSVRACSLAAPPFL